MLAMLHESRACFDARREVVLLSSVWQVHLSRIKLISNATTEAASKHQRVTLMIRANDMNKGPIATDAPKTQ